MTGTPVERLHPEIADAVGLLGRERLDADTVALIRTIEFTTAPMHDPVFDALCPKLAMVGVALGL